MNENYPMGRTMVFHPDTDLDLAFTAAAITKAQALLIGNDFCEATDRDRTAMLAQCGAVIIRKSLRILAAAADSVGDDDAARYARDLRNDVGAYLPTTTEAGAA